MILYLSLLAIVSLLFLIIIFRHYRKVIRLGRPEHLAFIRVLVSWILLFTFVGSTGTAIYAATHADKTDTNDQASTAVKKESTKPTLSAVSVNFNPEKPALNASGNAEVTFKVSAQTKLKIVGHYSKTDYKTFAAKKGYKAVTHKYKFGNDGSYDIIAQRGNKKVIKHLTIKGEDSASSSSSSISSSSSSSSSSSAVSSSSKPVVSSSSNRYSARSTYHGGSAGNTTGSTGVASSSSSEHAVNSNEYSDGQ